MADTSEDTVLEGDVVGQIVPAIRLDSKAPRPETKRVPLFYIDDTEYTVPAKPSPTVGLKYLRLLAREGEGQANEFLLRSLLGEKGYVALMNYTALTEEQFDQVMERAVSIATGPKERQRTSQAGRNGSNVRRRSSGR
jgi:hypothetical protein